MESEIALRAHANRMSSDTYRRPLLSANEKPSPSACSIRQAVARSRAIAFPNGGRTVDAKSGSDLRPLTAAENSVLCCGGFSHLLIKPDACAAGRLANRDLFATAGEGDRGVDVGDRLPLEHAMLAESQPAQCLFS